MKSDWKVEMMSRRRQRKGLAKLAKLKNRIENSSLLIEGLEHEMRKLSAE